MVLESHRRPEGEAMHIVYSYQGSDRKGDFHSDATTVTVGRHREGAPVDLDVTELDQERKTVSRPHARIGWENGRYWIEDLGSTRGTLVDGVDIKKPGKKELRPGQTVQMGDLTLEIVVSSVAAVPPVRVTVCCLPAMNYSLHNVGVRECRNAPLW